MKIDNFQISFNHHYFNCNKEKDFKKEKNCKNVNTPVMRCCAGNEQKIVKYKKFV